MSLHAQLRHLDADLPACPQPLIRLLGLLHSDDASTADMAEIIEADMALASAVVRTVNGAMFGLLRRVQTVGEALRYLGTREVAAITFETALRAAFTPTPALQVIWSHASRAGLLMGRSARVLGLDALHAHTSGLFARSGQAVLLAKLGSRYADLLAQHASGRAILAAAELAEFGVSHAAYGSALCASWGLAPEVVRFVREQGRDPTSWVDQPDALRRMLSLGAVVDALLLEEPVGRTTADATVEQQAHDLARELTPASGYRDDELWAAVNPPWQRLRTAV